VSNRPGSNLVPFDPKQPVATGRRTRCAEMMTRSQPNYVDFAAFVVDDPREVRIEDVWLDR
jgi:hypothetical protein